VDDPERAESHVSGEGKKPDRKDPPGHSTFQKSVDPLFELRPSLKLLIAKWA
jgi:hypothetical protein